MEVVGRDQLIDEMNHQAYVIQNLFRSTAFVKSGSLYIKLHNMLFSDLVHSWHKYLILLGCHATRMQYSSLVWSRDHDSSLSDVGSDNFFNFTMTESLESCPFSFWIFRVFYPFEFLS